MLELVEHCLRRHPRRLRRDVDAQLARTFRPPLVRVAGALFNKGVTLGALDRSEDELGAYDEVVARYGDATEPILRRAVPGTDGTLGT